jgi:hypothetical protein
VEMGTGPGAGGDHVAGGTERRSGGAGERERDGSRASVEEGGLHQAALERRGTFSKDKYALVSDSSAPGGGGGGVYLPPSPPPPGPLLRLYRSRLPRALILLVSFALSALCLTGIPKVEKGLDLSDVIPRDLYVYRYAELYER